MIRRAGFGRPVRAGRPGLIGTAARTAVVAGTASAVAGGVNRRQESRAAEQQQYAQNQQQQWEQQPTAQPGGPGENDRLAKLQQLGQLRDQGVLTDQEFEAEKSRLLASLAIRIRSVLVPASVLLRPVGSNRPSRYQVEAR